MFSATVCLNLHYINHICFYFVFLELMDFPLFSNGFIVFLAYGSKYDKFCIELGKSKLICKIIRTLMLGVIGDAVQVCLVFMVSVLCNYK